MPNANPAIRQYKEGNYIMINDYLRYQKIPEKKTAAEMNTLVAGIHDQMKACPARILYRGGSIRETGYYTLDSLMKSKKSSFTWKGFTSTSIAEHCAFSFIKEVLYVITTTGDTMQLDMMQFKDLKHSSNEKEVLLDYNTKYQIQSITEVTKKGKTYSQIAIQLL